MDESGTWSILTDTLQYVKAEVDSSVTYSFFDENTSVVKNYNAKKENFDAANYNVPNVPIYSQQLFPDFV